MLANYAIGLTGMWLFCDAWFSLALYIGKEDEKFLRNHLIRLVRLVLGLYLIIYSGLLIS